MRLFSGGGGDSALELAVGHALVRRMSAGDVAEALRVYRPSAPVVAFGRRDTRLPGFGAAVRAARAAGFEPL
ncbi:MAG TPA: lipoate--protein ligase, partial [Kribbella sp.]|nr:lipoate--protein ligase [Kribbella sp.]